MKSGRKIFLIVLLFCVGMSGMFAQQYQKGMTYGGATGLFVIPTGRIGWEKSQFGFDVGYGAMFGDNFKNYGNAVKATFSLFKIVELGAVWDGEFFNNSNFNYSNVIIHAKVQAYKKGAASLAVGGNFQMNHLTSNTSTNYLGGQIYVAATFSGAFFEWPASTTVFFGKSFYKPVDWDFDLGMGFELSLFPKQLKEVLSLVVELGNFSYVAQWPNSGLNAGSRGIANVGLRIDPIKGKNFKLGIDVLGTDLFDSNRSLGLQVCFGLAI